MANDRLEFYRDRKGDHRWRRIASNGEIVGASSEGYRSKKDCEANANRDTNGDDWEFYRDKAGGYRWRCFSPVNKKQVGKSTEAFSSRRNAEENARLNGWRGK